MGKRLTMTEQQANLRAVLKSVIEDGETRTITHRGDNVAVLMPYDDWLELSQLYRDAQVNAEADRGQA